MTNDSDRATPGPSRAVDEQIPITVSPTSNVGIARCFNRLEDHVYPRMRAAGLLATVNTDDPALSDMNLGQEYAAVARAFKYTWDDMVQIALDGVQACWLPESDKAALRPRIIEAGTTLRPDDGPQRLARDSNALRATLCIQRGMRSER